MESQKNEPLHINRKILAVEIKQALKQERDLKISAKTVEAILETAVDCITANLVEGNRVVLRDFLVLETVLENGRPLNMNPESDERSETRLAPRVKISRNYKNRVINLIRQNKGVL